MTNSDIDRNAPETHREPVLLESGTSCATRPCTACNSPFDAVTVAMHGRPIFTARYCDECVAEEERKIARMCSAGTIPFREEVPEEFRDFKLELLSDAGRKLLVPGVWDSPRMILCGFTGTGKSYTAAAIALKRASLKHRTFFVSAAKLRNTFTPTESMIQRERNETIRRRIFGAKNLIIDDLGHGKWSEAFGEFVLEMLNERRRMNTIITCQAPPEQWAERATGTVAEETMSAIVRRVNDYFDRHQL